MNSTIRLLASFFTMAIVTIVGVILFFRPVAEADVAGMAWSAPVALAVYAGLSVLLMDWTAKRIGSSYAAAFVVAASQAIFIVDLLARGERGYKTALAGVALVAVTWTGLGFVHSKLSRQQSSR